MRQLIIAGLFGQGHDIGGPPGDGLGGLCQCRRRAQETCGQRKRQDFSGVPPLIGGLAFVLEALSSPLTAAGRDKYFSVIYYLKQHDLECTSKKGPGLL